MTTNLEITYREDASIYEQTLPNVTRWYISVSTGDLNVFRGTEFEERQVGWFSGPSLIKVLEYEEED